MITKKRILSILCLVALCAGVFALYGCGNLGTNGKYCEYSGSSLDKTSYIELKSGKWTDDDGLSGTYEIDDTKITFYTEILGSKEEFCSGTISDGKLTIKILGISSTYYKEGKEPSST